MKNAQDLANKQKRSKKATPPNTTAKRRTAKPAAVKSAAVKSAPSKSAAAKSAAVKSAAAKKVADRPVANKTAKKALTEKAVADKALVKHGMRADLGAPIDGFFAKQSPAMRPILEALRELVEAAMPDAHSSIKWGMPFFTIGGAMVCALGGHKKHVNLILAGPPGTFADPEGLLSPEVKTGRRLTLSLLDELPRKAVQGWLRTAAQLARKQSTAG